MKNRKGFTIVELVIVIAVIAILAAVLIPTFSGVIGKANVSARTQEFTNALKVVLASNAETGGLAEGTVFISDDGYYAVYNGNKLGEITAIDDDANGFSLTIPTSAATKTTYSVGTTVETVDIQSVIMLYDKATTKFDDNSLKTLAKLADPEATDACSVSYATAGNTVSVTTNLTLQAFINLDLPKGFVVLSPSTSR